MRQVFENHGINSSFCNKNLAQFFSFRSFIHLLLFLFHSLHGACTCDSCSLRAAAIACVQLPPTVWWCWLLGFVVSPPGNTIYDIYPYNNM